MPEIKFDLKRTGFPVKIGSVELWFDSSFENLRRFFNINEIAQEKLKEAQENAKHIHCPSDFEDYELEDYTEEDIENIDAAFDVNSEFIAAQYDIIFGDGTFKTLYERHPDIWALESILESVGVAIAKRVEEQEIERSTDVENEKSKYLQKKEEKTK